MVQLRNKSYGSRELMEGVKGGSQSVSDYLFVGHMDAACRG